MIASLDGGEQAPLFSDGTTHRGHADWSPDGAMLAYVRDEPDGTADIRVIGRDGSDDRLLIDCAPPCAFAEEPAWSPDGSRIAYWTNGDDQPQVINVADATTGETLVTVAAPDPLIGPITPRWSPDGRYLTAHAEVWEQVGDDYQLVDGRIGVIDLEADEPVMELITPVGMKAMYPDWSPDGSRILFVAGNIDPFFGSDDPNDLYTVRPDGSDLRRLTERPRGEPRFGTPTWTEARPPIVVSLIQGGGFTLGALEANGSGLRELTTDGKAIPGAHPRVWVEP
jgi:Tol biopolymer transport system component